MKRFIAVILFCYICSSAFCQQFVLGSADKVVQNKQYKLEIDYSEAEILNMPEKEYALYEDDWLSEGKKDLFKSFKKELNSECDNYHFSEIAETSYKMVFHVLSLDQNLKVRTSCKGYITIEKDGEILARVDGFKDTHKGIGTSLHLFSGLMSDMGDKVAEFFNNLR